jgi:hypothetical protein
MLGKREGEKVVLNRKNMRDIKEAYSQYPSEQENETNRANSKRFVELLGGGIFKI